MIIIFMLLILFGLVLLLKNETYLNGYGYDAFTNKNNKNGKNVVLIGDSMLNNSNYVFQGESVPDLLSKKLVNNFVTLSF